MNNALLYLSSPYPGYHRKSSQYNKNKLNDNEPCGIETAMQSHIEAAERYCINMLRGESVLQYYDATDRLQSCFGMSVLHLHASVV